MKRSHRRSVALALVLALIVPFGAPATAYASAQDSDNGSDESCEQTDDGAKGNKKGKKKKQEADECGPPEPPPPPPVPVANLGSPTPVGIDVDLQGALANVGFLDSWYALTLTSPRLSLVPAAGPEAEASRQAVLDQVGELVSTRESTTVLLNVTQDAVGRRRMVERQIDVVDEQISSLVAQRLATIDTRTALEADLERVLQALRGAAVGMYVNEEQVTVDGISDVSTYNDQRELAERVDATIEELLSQRDELETRIATQEARITELTATIEVRQSERESLVDQREGLSATIAGLRDDIADLTTQRVALETSLPETIGEAHIARMTATAPALGINMVSLDSYVRAADDIADYYPSCRMRWQLLGGIATVESDHGRFGGAWVNADGKVSARILGPVLDGTVEDTAVITDSDGGRMDGNAAYDRAVGPFQFLPSTWRAFGLDSDGDGIADPHNMYDGALSAAGYLCAHSSMATDGGVHNSVLAYNASGQYLYDVTRFTRKYILSLGIPEPAFDPDELVEESGWTIILSDSDEWAEIGQIGKRSTDDESGDPERSEDPVEITDLAETFSLDPSTLRNTGD